MKSEGADRTCIIFNPAARGEKARRFREFLSAAATGVDLRPTTGPGAARELAREAVRTGFTRVIAAGGDGTAFEVLNGLADEPEGLANVALGVLPLGTANVFAHELALPPSPVRAWKALQTAVVRPIDCGLAEFQDEHGAPRRAHFAIVAGAGLDARAVALVDWAWKKRIGKLAYIWAALRAFANHPDLVRCSLGGRQFRGRVVLAGNGRYYAGAIPVFPGATLDSGCLHLCGFERVTPGVLGRCLWAYATGRWTLGPNSANDAVHEVHLTADGPVPLQLDGELAGWLPATLRILPGQLRVLVPAGRLPS